jgi:hypothetical protein
LVCGGVFVVIEFDQGEFIKGEVADHPMGAVLGQPALKKRVKAQLRAILKGFT